MYILSRPTFLERLLENLRPHFLIPGKIKSMIKAVIFDIGGVLLDDPEYVSFWGESDESKQLRDLFGTGKISIESFVASGARLLKLSPQTFLEQYSKAYSGMKRNLQAWDIYQKLNVPKIIFSDTNPIHFKYCSKLYGEIFESASNLFLSFEVRIRKNSKESYEYLLSKVPYNASELVFIDNNLKYLQLAKELGMHTILYSKSTDLRSELLAIDPNIIDWAWYKILIWK